MTVLNAEKLTLGDVHRLFGLQRLPVGTVDAVFTLEPLSDFEHQELNQIATDFEQYLVNAKVSEGLVKALTIFPLLRLAGYYQFPTELSLEEGIGRITVEDEETDVTGRLDILAMTRSSGEYPFWLLIIESKNSVIDISAGLPQLLTYAFRSLERQKFVWGLVTNGLNYQFVVLRQGTPPTYQSMPLLPLMESNRAIEMLQVLKAIRKLQQGDSLKQTAA
jgi:hypothetical protein